MAGAAQEIAPRLTRAAVLRDSANPAAIGQFGAIQAMAPSLGVELRPIDKIESRLLPSPTLQMVA